MRGWNGWYRRHPGGDAAGIRIGGTTGRPKRIADFTAWDEEAATTNSALDEHAFPAPDIFPGIKFAGQYGNTVMGATMQRPRGDDDPARCVFRSLYPRAHVDVVDFADPTRLVAYGARGRVRVHRLTRDMFLPNMIERDSAIRVARVDGDDDLADVRPCSPDELNMADADRTDAASPSTGPYVPGGGVREWRL